MFLQERPPGLADPIMGHAMGVYNIVNRAARCPKCGGAVEWQSKYLVYDGYVLANAMQEVALAENVDGEMHATCRACWLCLEATVSKGQLGPISKVALPAPIATP